MLSSDLRDLTSRAIDYAVEHHNGDEHTVAAAMRTSSGTLVYGLNTFHFLGGPCGEISALSNHAAEHPDDPISAVVAAYGPTGSVISLCGKCRQVLYDINPEILCVVRGHNGFEALPIHQLLPHAYNWREMDEPQKIYMWEGYEDSIRNGTKQQTIRIDDPFQTGPALLVFEKPTGETVTLTAEVNEVVRLRREELTEDHARKDGFNTLEELHTALDTHYPGLNPEDPVDLVSFRTQNND